MKKVLLFVFAVGSIYLYSSIAKNNTQIEDEIHKNILSHFYHKKGWKLQTRRNIDLIFKIKSVGAKDYYPLWGNGRKLYKVQYTVSYRAKSDCALFRFVPKELDAYVHDLMKMECYGKNDKIKGPSHKSNERSWKLEREYRHSRSVFLKAGKEVEDKNMTLYVAINDNLKGFKFAPKVHWMNYSKVSEGR